MDREKVIRQMEEISDYFFSIYHHSENREEIIEAKDRCDAVEEALAMLKEQEKRNEPVAPICSQEIFGTFLVCGNCGEKLENVLEAESIDSLPIKWRYCRKCGREIKWNEC